MTYPTLMVHLALGRPNAALLQVTHDLAARFHTRVIGIAACQPMQLDYGDGYICADVIDLDRAQIDTDIGAARAEFHTAFASRPGTTEWRSAVVFTSLPDYVACEARAADLLITGTTATSIMEGNRRASTGDIVMQIGRPVLVVPAAAARPKLDRIMIGWKDTRETRRAVVDALPLLRTAAHVSLVEIADAEDLAPARARLADVAAWLGRHDIRAECVVSPPSADDAARLDSIARDQDADLVVAGAYGHSRLREWALGGVTRGLLLHSYRCSLLSH